MYLEIKANLKTRVLFIYFMQLQHKRGHSGICPPSHWRLFLTFPQAEEKWQKWVISVIFWTPPCILPYQCLTAKKKKKEVVGAAWLLWYTQVPICNMIKGMSLMSGVLILSYRLKEVTNFLCFTLFLNSKNDHISAPRCQIEMGFESKCFILNRQMIYIEKFKLNIADMWRIPLDRVTL